MSITHDIKRHLKLGCLFLFLFSGISCAEQNTQKVTADKVLIKARVYTVDVNNPWAEAVAVKNGKIIFVGSNREAQDYIAKQTKVIDLQGRMVVPGFQDAHVHPLEGVSLTTFMGCDLIPLSDTETNPETWIDELKKCNKIDFPHDWILGGGHAIQDVLKLKRMPKLVLDEAFPDKPAAFMEKSSHSMWVNSKALEIVGITKDTPDPQGGLIFKDPQTGEPTGLLSDSAGDELMHKALQRSPKLQQARYEALMLSQDFMAKYGLTSITNGRVYWERGNLEPWLRAEKEGTLKARSIMALWAYPHLQDDFQLPKLKSMYRDDRDSLLRLSQIKFYSDGVVINNSAAVVEAYNHLIHPFAKPFGLNYFTEKRLAKYITELEKVGFDAHIHGLGDRAVKESLNAIESAQKANSKLKLQTRHQITHVALARKEDIPRFAKLNVTANIQINHDTGDYGTGVELDKKIDYKHVHIDDPDYWFKIVGDVDVEFSPVHPIIESGGRMVFSSDWDVSSIDPIVSIQNAVNILDGKMSKDEAIATAIKGYTLNPAYIMRHDDMTGSIEVGKYADLVVLDSNLFELPKQKIKQAKVLLTLLSGNETYRAKEYR
ncbi:amidohydrolase [Aliikangiella coralliicola]|uniref:Amidohydrolase n=1 Tax=Aliikangiella coralliicola TaxID=2592383 RepID=A0A545UD69_9GAMM|nr:amidohydrolase [Aliikangiella coralliicola]TQV87410.1 amidohydrolase [Aliikangiella coralliicola]